MTELHRLDQWLVALQLVSSRQRAEVLIKEGGVQVNGQVVKKPGKKFDETAEISVIKEPMKWVSRGALKLISALDQFQVNPENKVCLDVGSSTGGFTEVLLDRGATKVFAVDTGTDQLAPSLRRLDQVISLERQNIRTIDETLISEPCALVVIDVSFISLRLVLPAIKRFMSPSAEVVALVKPQFEVGQDYLGKNGIVRDVTAREKARRDIILKAEELGFQLKGQIDSPITGGDGNHEYLIHLS
ncbi:TlyA family RNA methyltransferase [Sanyastnella coralliicola]|uniref:TlyA family RNA methyltransferase n=1 Tax=Sanyastnella coralliicola TaxID=3069118 RepID=UPI0027BA0AF2|nr:TlyA family RNA methyltransferase [Longitalea sp. SCSIO 12813]